MGGLLNFWTAAASCTCGWISDLQYADEWDGDITPTHQLLVVKNIYSIERDGNEILMRSFD